MNDLQLENTIYIIIIQSHGYRQCHEIKGAERVLYQNGPGVLSLPDRKDNKEPMVIWAQGGRCGQEACT